MNTHYGKDVMKDITEACEKHDMKFVIKRSARAAIFEFQIFE